MKPDAEGWCEMHSKQAFCWPLCLRCSQSQSGNACIATYLQLCNRLFDLLDLHLAEAFQLEECLAGGSVDRLSSVSKSFYFGEKENSHGNSVVAIGLELCDVCCSHTC